ncbi:E9 [Serinus canaria papillomavirus 1]|uniref:E9 n=1 Tax=Serinus canaria papillomavirus 1 TaxID=2094713 RepID=UPI000D0C07C9|nr:E9 [Serinus canaria papillomavirus 1]AVH76291.1 E9 [Serinus canaria papillomavirus 1]
MAPMTVLTGPSTEVCSMNNKGRTVRCYCRNWQEVCAASEQDLLPPEEMFQLNFRVCSLVQAYKLCHSVPAIFLRRLVEYYDLNCLKPVLESVKRKIRGYPEDNWIGHRAEALNPLILGMQAVCLENLPFSRLEVYMPLDVLSECYKLLDITASQQRILSSVTQRAMRACRLLRARRHRQLGRIRGRSFFNAA